MRRVPDSIWNPICSLALGLACATAGHAQPPRPDELVVEGRQIEREAAQRETGRIIRRLARKGYDRQLARWMVPVCPVVHGASGRAQRAILGKLRAVASKAGAPMAAGRCRPNLVIAFHPAPGDVFRAYAKRSGGDIFQLRELGSTELETGTRTVRWWHEIDFRGANGDAAGAPGASPLLPGSTLAAPTLRAVGSDRLRSQVAIEVVSGGVLVDSKKVEGRPLAPLAAHIAMVALAPMEMPDAPLGMPSIANLFDGGGTATDLTEWDLAYLEALYDIIPARPGSSQRRTVARQVAQRVTEP